MNAAANPNKALWEKGDFTRIAASMRESGEAVVAGLGVTPGLFERENRSQIKDATSIPATFLRVTVAR
jgi:hypothetical protein